jgi:hypothetical protein
LYGGVEVKLHTFLTSGFGGCVCSASLTIVKSPDLLSGNSLRKLRLTDSEIHLIFPILAHLPELDTAMLSTGEDEKL